MDLTELTNTSLLGIYLNDHLAGATAGVSLIERTAAAQAGTPAGPPLAKLAKEIAEDREALVEIMSALGVGIARYKLAGAWVAERAGRLKLNGRLLERSPLSSLVELEGMKLGVEGKAALWRSLRALADDDARLDISRLEGLIARAKAQSKTLEKLRLAAAEQALTA
ncbi:MAG: hypothetical protein ACR2J5_15470 [Geodermatophilaceae bacterium]|jgi:predicted DNA-binding ribbon-helix-helix protein